MITVVTLLRGGIANPSPLEWFTSFPEGSKLLAGVNNLEDASKVEALGGTSVFVSKWDGQGGEMGRHQHVATLKNTVLAEVVTEHLFIFDDDIIPTASDIERMCTTGHLLPPGGAGLCGLYPFQGTTWYPCYFSEVMDNLPFESLPKDVPVIFTAAMGFSFWKTDVIKSALPLVVREKFGSPQGTEVDFGFKMKSAGLDVYAEGKVRVKHVSL